MKYIITLVTLISLNITIASEQSGIIFEDQDLECEVTSKDKRYEDIFLVKVRNPNNESFDKKSQLYYKRRHLAVEDGGYGEYEIVRGCFHGIQETSPHRPTWISVKCQSDGEEGIIDINSETLNGQIYFYMPKIGYPERISLSIQCTRIN